jgi:iron complex transport system substrate-binding protein
MRQFLILALVPLACSREAPPPGAPPHRIVCLSCAGTDIFIALGELDRVVAVEEDCPCPGTEDKVKIRNEDHPGKLAPINVESILALEPDLVIAQPDLRQALEGRGLRVIWTVDHYTYANIPDLVRKIGKVLGIPERAQALLDGMKEKEAEIRARTKGLPRVSVYYETTGIGWTMGNVGVMNSMIELAGGRNIADEIPKTWAVITPEAIFKADPDVIIMGPWAESAEAAKARPGWDKLKAVREGRVYKIEPEQRNVAQGTPRCVDECERLLLPWLHPELGGPGH